MGGTVDYDIWKTDGTYALTFTEAFETWTIPDLRFVGSYDGIAAVYSDAYASVLINNGNILSANAVGVLFDVQSDYSEIVNNIGASIAGLDNGVDLNGYAQHLFNFGRIIGFKNFGIHFGDAAEHFEVDNSGEVFG